MDKELKKLIDEVDQLRKRVTLLEQQTRFTEATTKELPNIKQTVTASTDTQIKDTTVRYYKPEEKKTSHRMSEEKLAGTLFNRLGILAIMVAAVFFFKWSFDNNLIGELGRIVIGIIVGLLFIGAGEYFQRRNFNKYAQGLTGGGVAILYFAIYTSFNFYHLLSQPVAFIIMVLITLAASLLAIRYDAITIGIIGIVGGFATPFLLSSNESNILVLFTYIAILDVGVLLIAYFKKWPIFHYLTFLFTYAAYTFAQIGSTMTHEFIGFNTLSFSFLTFYFIIYLVISFTRNIRKRESLLWADSILILLNGVAYFSLSYLLLIPYVEDWIGLWAVFLGLIYLLIGLYIYRHFTETRMLSLLLLSIAAGFVTLAVPLQLDGYWTPAAWAIEAIILFYLSFKINPGRIPYAGVIVLVLSIFSLVTEPYVIHGNGFVAILNKTGAAYVEVIAAMAVILWMYYKETRSTKTIMNRNLIYVLQITLNLLVISLLTSEVNAYFYGLTWNATEIKEQMFWISMKNLVISIVWGLQAATLVLLGFWRRMTGIRWFGLSFMVVVIIKVFLFDLSNLSTPNRIISFMGLGLILLGISWLYHRYKNKLLGGNEDENQRNEKSITEK
jgi:Predicted membrane protein